MNFSKATLDLFWISYVGGRAKEAFCEQVNSKVAKDKVSMCLYGVLFYISKICYFPQARQLGVLLRKQLL